MAFPEERTRFEEQLLEKGRTLVLGPPAHECLGARCQEENQAGSAAHLNHC